NQERRERIDAQRLRGDEGEVSGEHDQVAVGDVDEPHHAEDQRQPGREHGVEPADQHTLDDDVDPVSHGLAPHARTSKWTVGRAAGPTSPRLRGEVASVARGEGDSPRYEFVESPPPPPPPPATSPRKRGEVTELAARPEQSGTTVQDARAFRRQI